MPVNGTIQLAYQDTAWFAANPTIVLLEGQHVYLSDGADEFLSAYVVGDGVTELQDLPWKGLGGTQTLQEVITESPIIEGILATSNDGNTVIDIADGNLNLGVSDAVDNSLMTFQPASIDVTTLSFKKNGSEIATVDDIGTNYTEKFTYTGGTYTLTAAPNYIYSIRTTTMILDETDSNDVTIVGTTLTVVNPNFLSGETLYIKYKA